MHGEPMMLGAMNQLYAAALGRVDWSSALEQVRDAFAGHHVLLATHDFGSGLVPFASSVGIDGRDRDRVLSEDAWRVASPYFGTVPLDAALPRGARVSDAEFVRSPFYTEFLRPARGFHSVGALLRGPGPLMASINICRLVYAGAYDAPDAAALQALVPYDAMALDVQAQLTADDARSRSLEATLERCALHSLVSDTSGRRGFLNARSPTLLIAADGLAV